MSEVLQSAKIYTFPVRGRFATLDRGEQLESSSLRVANGIVSSGSWYHEQAINDAGTSPRGRLLAIFDSAPGSRLRGCPFHNAAVEAAGAMPGVEDIVHEHKLDFTARIIQAATEAGARDPYRLGNQLAVLFEGALALATSLNDTSPLLHARSAAEMLIDAATIDSGK